MKAEPLLCFFSLISGLAKDLFDGHAITGTLILYYKLLTRTILKIVPQGTRLTCGAISD